MAGYQPARGGMGRGAIGNDIGFSPGEAVNALFPSLAPVQRPPVGNALFGAGSNNLQELRRQQEAFHKVVGNLDRQNSWMALPALAPVAAPLILPPVAEAGLTAIFGAVPPIATKGPLRFVNPGIALTKGDNIFAQAGRAADRAYRAKFEAKGWAAQKKIDGSRLRPDGTIPSKKPGATEDRFYVELKPNTPTGRAKGASQIQTYKDVGGKKGRVIYYDPKDFLP